MSVSPVSLASMPLPTTEAAGGAASVGGPSFGGMVNRLLNGAAQAEASASNAIQGLVTGQTDNLHGVLLQVAQADLSFRLILEIRNRLTEAYQDIMKMQI